MPSAKKNSVPPRNARTPKWLIATTILIIILVVSTVIYIWNPTKTNTNTIDTPEGLKALANHYIEIMQTLNSTQTKTAVVAQLDSAYNQTDLFAWEQTKLTFVQDTTGYFEDPLQILESGKGICVQWSILYVSACLSLGYESRLVASIDTSNWNAIHVWAEDYYNGEWIHVDPSDKIWNSPSRYQSWDWGSGIGSNVKIYAFEDNAFIDVIASYSVH
jgi:hypothetical protein